MMELYPLVIHSSVISFLKEGRQTPFSKGHMYFFCLKNSLHSARSCPLLINSSVVRVSNCVSVRENSKPHVKLSKRILHHIKKKKKKKLRKSQNASDISSWVRMPMYIALVLGIKIPPSSYCRFWHSNQFWFLVTDIKCLKNPHINWIINPVTRLYIFKSNLWK